MSTPSPPSLISSSSSGESSSVSLAPMNRVSIQNLCHPGSTNNSDNTPRRGSIQDILNDEPSADVPAAPVSDVTTSYGRKYSQHDILAAEMLGNLKSNGNNNCGTPSQVHATVQNPFEVPIQTQPGYQPLKGLYSETYPPNNTNSNLNLNLHERDTANANSNTNINANSSDKGCSSSSSSSSSHFGRFANTKPFARDSPYHSRAPSVDFDFDTKPSPSFLNRVYQSSKSYSPRFRYGAEIVERWATTNTANTKSNATKNMPKAMSAKSLDATVHMASNGGMPSLKSSLHDFERLKSGIDDIQNSTTDNTHYSVDVGPQGQGLHMRIHTSPRRSPPSAGAPGGEVSPSGESSAQMSSGRAPGQPRSAWQEVLISATSLASLSQDSRKRLRYCLHLLKLANAHLASTVTKLQGAIAEETAYSLAQSIAANHVPHNERQAYLHHYSGSGNRNGEPSLSITALKADVVSTIRKIVKVVSQYAGNSLPEPARSHIRTYILGLPSRWASTSASANITPTRSPATSQSPVGSPKECVTPNHQGPPLPTNTVSSPAPEAPSDEQLTRHRIEVEAGGKVLILANEALDMLHNIISIVDGTLERAEGWCEGINRVKQRFGAGAPEGAVEGAAEGVDETAEGASSGVATGAEPSTTNSGEQEDVEMGDA